jgi:hypothetical protein
MGSIFWRFRMSKKIIIATPYNYFVIVTLAQAEALMQCPVYKENGWGSDTTYTEEGELIVKFVDESALSAVNQVELDMKEIIAENCRLTRLVEELSAKLAPSTSTELEPIQ